MKTTMEHIAETLGVSKVAVHRALTGTDGVSDALRKKILDTADRMGYVYNSHRMLKRRTFLYLTKRFYFLNDHENFYSVIYRKLEALCVENEAKLVLQLYETEEEKAMIERMVYSDSRICGIFVSGQFPLEDMRYFASMPLPVVVIDHYCPTIKLSYVYLPYYNDAYRLTCYAIERGHTQIGYVGHVRDISALTDRYFGFRKALLEFKIPLRHEWVFTEKVEDKATFTIKLPQKLPTVFICHCDLTANKLITALRLQHVRVPEEVSVLSFDNTDTALETDPKLTSIGVEKSAFAHAALTLMQNKLKNPDRVENVRLESVIYERESCPDRNREPTL